MNKSKLKTALMKYFEIDGDCYHYNLTRVKSARLVGTLTIDDFVEFDEEIIDDIVDFAFKQGECTK